MKTFLSILAAGLLTLAVLAPAYAQVAAPPCAPAQMTESIQTQVPPPKVPPKATEGPDIR